MTTNDLHSSRSRYSFAWMYSGLKPNVVRSPEQTTRSGWRSLTSAIARSIRFGTKYGPPQWRSEMWAIVKHSWAAITGVYGPSGAVGILVPVGIGTSRFPGISWYRGAPVRKRGGAGMCQGP